jgi:8-oxo-dGTP pyrophosphatase MutT (NUDIX family)
VTPKRHFDRIVATLETSLQAPLPGLAAQALMAPQPARQWPAGFQLSDIRHAAGLLLLFPVDDRAHVVLTVRAHTLDRHGGQVSLPGGVVEAGETFEQAALREAHEEIALATTSVRVLGALTPIDITVSGFRLHPVVAVAGARPLLTPADGEVGRILEVPLDLLLDSRRIVWRARTRDGRVFHFPVFPVDADAEIWGATAMVLAELLSMLGWTGPPARSIADSPRAGE